MPPPQPTSSTCFPARLAWRSIQSRRSGLISCSGRNSPCGSHQRWASLPNFSSSAGSAFMGSILKTKSPAGAGLFVAEKDRLVLARADDLDLGAPVLGAAVGGLVARHGLLLALALGVDAVGLDALGGQVGLDRLGAAHRQPLVVLVG